ncbi:MAG: hypothetical protein II996_03010 [Oscillospiraceae bacterium]|nr:hypothetical protein [Oscillospiraceae bacterium]
MDTGRLRNNYKYYDDSYMAITEIILKLKESPDFNIHIEEDYFGDIFGHPVLDGKGWHGFTRDYCECKGAWDFTSNEPSEISDLHEYLYDMLQYSQKQFDYEETKEVFELIADFLRYAITTGQTVVVEVE